MDFDFFHLYKDYPNAELLKILKQPQDYQPAAIAAVTKILQERQVSDTDVQQADQYFENVETTAKQKKEKINAYKEKVADFLEPVLQPQQAVYPRKWLNILLLVIAVQYAWTLIGYIRHIVRYIDFVIKCRKNAFNANGASVSWWDCAMNRMDIILFLELVSLVYVPVIFYLLWARRRWGWILLFADNLFSLASLLGQSYAFFAYQFIHHGDPVVYLLQVLLRVGFAFFLWKKVISDYFDVPQPIKIKTVVVTMVIFLCFIGGIKLSLF